MNTALLYVPTEISATEQQLVCGASLVNDNRSLTDDNIQNRFTLHLNVSLKGGSSCKDLERELAKANPFYWLCCCCLCE